MKIEDDAAADQMDGFRQRVTARAADHGQAGGVAYGERFKAIMDL